jgi:MFS family permease
MTSLLLRQPNFRWLWLGQTFLFCGVQFWFVALTWLMLQRTGSGTSLALVLMGAALPRALLMLPGGALSDHHPPRPLAIRAAWVLALCTAVLTLLAQRNALDPGPVATLAALFGSAEACLYPAVLALLPRLVAPRLLGQAHAWLQGSEQISNVAGPALAGLALALSGATAALALDTALLLLAAGCFLQLRPRPVPWLREATGGLLRGMGESLGFAWHHRAIRTGLGLIAMINLAVLGPVVIGVVELVSLRFGGGAATFGSLQAAYGVGALVGVALAGRCSRQPLRHPAAALGWLAAALGLGLLGLAAAGHAWVAAAVLAAMGVGGGLVGVLATAWLQRETPGPLQGRVMALAMVAGVAFDPLSQALAGVLLDVSLTALFLAGGGALLLTALLVLRPSGARAPITSQERSRRLPASGRADLLQQVER